MSQVTEQDIRSYLENSVDPYLKPLLKDLVKQRPQNVQEFMSNWMKNQGKTIHDQRTTTTTQTET